MSTFIRKHASFLALLVLLGLPSVLLTIDAATDLLPLASWPSAILQTDLRDPAHLLARHSFLPQIAVALLSGAALSLSGVLMQHTLKNPIAEPTTLGTSAGAGLALTLATIFAPWMLEDGRELIALGGAIIATTVVFMIANRGRFSVSVVVLAGMIVAMTASAATGVFLSLFTDYMGELFIWQSGALAQNGDRTTILLASWFLAIALMTALLARPLSLLSLDDTTVSSLGLKPWLVRLIAIGFAIALAASVASAVGIIAFIGLAAPTFARATGARTFGQQAFRATVIGALLLLFVDRLSEAFSGEMPAGSLTALIGAPLLFLLIRKLPSEIDSRSLVVNSRSPIGVYTMFGAILVVAALALTSLTLGPTLDGWHTGQFSFTGDNLKFRWPRVLGAASAGVLLALAGGTMQRITGNPLAAPEALGVSGGATIGVLALLSCAGGVDQASLALGAAFGAIGSGMLISILARREGFRADRLLLYGLTLTMMATGWASVFLASGDPRAGWIMSWLSGSTYRLQPPQAIFAATLSAVALVIVSIFRRWLAILPLGRTVTLSVGVPVAAAWSFGFAFSALATGIATLLVGPLSFVGLAAPHLAKLSGLRDVRHQMLTGGAIGAAIMIAADWLGRVVVFPWETPAGIIAAFIGGPYMLWALRRSR